MTHPINILSLEDVAAHFAHWRQTRLSPKEQIPDNLKEEVVSLIGRYSNRIILKTLRLNNGSAAKSGQLLHEAA